MMETERRWFLRGDQSAQLEGVPAGVEYHRVLAGEKRRIMRGLLAIALLLAGMIGFGVSFTELSKVIDVEVLGRTEEFTPLRHIAGSLSLVVLIPYSMLLQRLLYGVSPGSLHSVIGRFRFSVFGKSLVVFGPLVLIAMSIPFLLQDGTMVSWTAPDLVAMFLAGLLVTPLAAAGEEYGFRGLMFRVVGGWTRSARVGLVLGIVVTTVVFSLAHGTLDPYLLTSYFVLFGTMAIITWRTGGLEAAVVLHGLYNLTLLLATMLHIDVLGQLASRAAAVGSFVNLIPSAALVVATAVIWWMTRGSGPARTARAERSAAQETATSWVRA
ncbi:CPBP family intramembrane glutamic endopeptidase [Myceligenerans xiligouense]|uniref:Membrane protease YdiL (CAAX protease family) n=1 Tax=Myceligenerans xiligouense TaxID=253184 RepID=A0A3N4YSG7_9MICO|nr:CPBP family intramembrane glutamic endopeptidase [Myceligenerans xiligouense]RPF22446.1 membrane protease YdiL (CAAX protease family) [Myceligenerans xiligouense]